MKWEIEMDRNTFDLQPPSWAKDDLDDATTNESIEIELVGVAETMADLDRGAG
tara:strand:- start:497 stop:655 length:159 start_codon:yes stop_codon:yes gene_type:complete